MPRYYFTTENGEVLRDHEGEELASDQAARIEAVKLMGAVLHDHPENFLDGGRWRMIVSEAPRGDLFTVEVSLQVGAEIPDWGDPEARSRPT